jgi:glycosyltransferase involved in cell wall biosynthesis
MQPIKVLHLSSERTWRGGEQQIAYLIEESTKAGLEVAVAVRPGSAFEDWCSKNGIRSFKVGFASGIAVKWALKLKLLAKEFDIVHVHSGKSHSIAYLAAVFGMKCPVVVHRRVDFPVGRNKFSLRKYNHPSVVGILCVSDVIATMVRATVSRPERVMTIHSGIDFSRFTDGPASGYLHSELGLPEGVKLVANISAVAPHKDYRTFVSTAASVLSTRHDVHFLVVGDGNLLEEIKAYALKSGLQGGITFTGFRSDVARILRELDIFLITSSTEGLGTTIIDAMYNSLPVVATRAGGIPELVEHEQTGLLCEIQDADCLAESINRLLDDKERSEQFGRAGHQRSLKFSKEAMAKKVIEFYKNALKL